MDAITKIAPPDIAAYNTTAIKPPESQKEQVSASVPEMHNQSRSAQKKSIAGRKEGVQKETVQNNIDEDAKVKEQNTELFKLKAVIAVDKDKNTVIQFIDKKGEVKQQFPPEEYLAMAKKMKEITKNLYSRKA
jgi:uncharacterized FlaG/YvyC family protein